MKFYENMFDDPPPAASARPATVSDIKATSNIPRVHVRGEVDGRGSTLSSGSSSSDRDRPRSSSGPVNWARWSAKARKIPVYE